MAVGFILSIIIGVLMYVSNTQQSKRNIKEHDVDPNNIIKSDEWHSKHNKI